MKFFKMIMKNEGGFFWLPMAIGAGAGLLKNKADKERVDKMNQAAAVQTAHSPNTGMGAGKIQQAPSGLEGAMQGAMAGMQFGQAGKAAGLWGAGAGGAAPGIANLQGQGTQMVQGAGGTMAGTQGSGGFGQKNPWELQGQQNPYAV